MMQHSHKMNGIAHQKTFLLVTLVFFLVVAACTSYCCFIKEKIQEESKHHLNEVYTQVNDMFSFFTQEAWNNLNDWSYSVAALPHDASAQVDNFIEGAQSRWGFSDFYFINTQGEYKSIGGSTGTFNLGDGLTSLTEDAQNIVTNIDIAAGSDLTLFAVPTTSQASYRGFEYSAVGISYTSTNMHETLYPAVFDGQSQCFVTTSGGRILFSLESDADTPYSYLTQLYQNSNVNESDFAHLRSEISNRNAGIITYRDNNTNYYLVYQPTDFQDWMILGVVSQDVINKEIGAVQQVTLLVVNGIIVFIGVIFIALILLKNKRMTQKATTKNLCQSLDTATKANKAKSVFLSHMSHDIRTPINAIFGMNEIALEHVGTNNKKATECLQLSMTSTKHLLGLIDDILDIEKIESGELSLHEQPFLLDALIEDIACIIRPQADARAQRFTIEFTSVTHKHLIGDALHIKQVLLNLLSNAVKYTHKGGSVSFVVHECDQADTSLVRLRFEVRDNGIGMSDEFLDHIFDAFERSEQAETSNIQGTGLGMPIAKHLVAAMGGTINVASELGVGTTFTVVLDVKIDTEAQHSNVAHIPEQTHHYDFHGKRFLLAEDNQINAMVVMELLKMKGACVDWGENGKCALDMFCEHPEGYYDFIFMDVQMPTMNGYDATVAIRNLSRHDAASIPIIALTANAFTEDAERALEAGMNAHVSKPIVMDALEKTLAEVENSIKKTSPLT